MFASLVEPKKHGIIIIGIQGIVTYSSYVIEQVARAPGMHRIIFMGHMQCATISLLFGYIGTDSVYKNI